MKFFKVGFSDEYAKKNCKFGLIDAANVADEYAVEDGKPLPEKMLSKGVYRFKSAPGKMYADYQMMYLPWRLISKRLYQIFIEADDKGSINYFPVDVQHEDTILSYFVMNFTSKLDVIEKQKSRYVEKTIWEPVLDVNKTPFPPIFKYKGAIGQSFCVSEHVRVQIIKARISGLQLKEVPIE